MADDDAPQEPRRGAGANQLPKIVSVRIARVRYDPPQQHVIKHKMTDVEEAVEVLIQTAEPIPERALAPALYIGEEVLTESEPAGHLRYRFFAFDANRLEEGAPIALGWTMSNSPRVKSEFHFHVKDGQ